MNRKTCNKGNLAQASPAQESHQLLAVGVSKIRKNNKRSARSHSLFNHQPSCREKEMLTILFQVALLALVAMSFVLVVGVPVAYATPQNWVESKKLLWIGSGVWFGLVLLVGVLNFLVV
jgi:photosystem II PsbZ protein